MWHTWGEYKCLLAFGWENLKGRDHVQELGVDEWIIMKHVLHEKSERA
jgi:hypothetical protein